MKNLLRVIAAFAIAPGMPALLVYLMQLPVARDWEAEWAARVFLLIGYCAAGLIGIPAYLLARWQKVKKLRTYMLGGGLIGVLSSALIFLPSVLVNWRSNHEHAVLLLMNGLPLMGAAAGVVAGGVFWFIAVRDRRTRDATNLSDLTTDRRRLSQEEISIIHYLLHAPGGQQAFEAQLPNCLCAPIGPNGCLRLFPAEGDRILHADHPVIAESAYRDADWKSEGDPLVRILLHAVDGRLHALEVFKDDGTPILRAPSLRLLLAYPDQQAPYRL